MSYVKNRFESVGTGDYKPAKYTSCYESHPALSIGDFKIYGGSCSTPLITNADVYVGFDHSMNHVGKQYPWSEGESFLFHIPDMGVPKSADDFKKLIEWLSLQLFAKKLVHIGCIGGHGRTGTVLAALVTHMTGNKDSIAYVRKHYCEKAVESVSQIKFLGEHFGVTEANPSKGHAPSASWGNGKSFPTMDNPKPQKSGKVEFMAPSGSYRADPTKNPISIWGAKSTFVKQKNLV